MKISSSGIGTVASGAVASAGSNSGGKRYIWAWDFSGANSWYGNSGYLGSGGEAIAIEKYGIPANPFGEDEAEHYGKNRGICYDQQWPFWFIESQEEGLLFQTENNYQPAINGLHFYIWEYSQLNRDDGKPVQISSDFVSNDWNKGNYFHLVLKTKGQSSPVTSGPGTNGHVRGSRVISPPNTDQLGGYSTSQGSIVNLNADLSGSGSGIGYTATGTGGLSVGGAGWDGRANTTHFLMKYNDNKVSNYEIGTSQSLVFSSDTYQTGDYRVIIFNLEDDINLNHPQSPAMFDFTLFSISPDNTALPTGNPNKIGAANISFMLCGMVLSNERLTDIPLPIDIHRT